jgi:hypothetical protein
MHTGLDALSAALDDLDVDPQRVAGPEVWNCPLTAQVLGLLFLELLDDVHRFTLVIFLSPA